MVIVVVGLGVVGALACRELARRGHNVVGLERFSVGHTHASSHGESRIIRRTYPDRLHTRLMDEAYPLWDALQSDAGVGLWERTGILYFGPPAHEEIVGVRASLDAERVPYRLDGPEETLARHGLRLNEYEIGLWQEDGGFVRAGDTVRQGARLATAHGADIREGAAVRRLVPDGDGVVVETGDGSLRADRVLLCAGAWMGDLVPELALPLRPTRQTFAYVATPETPATAPNLVWIDAATYWYGFPADGRLPGVKLARHVPGDDVHPDRVPRTVDDAERTAAAEVARQRIPGAGDVLEAATCLYTNTPDEHFVLDHALGGRATVASACSGHGFKFAPLVARLAADAVENGRWRDDLTPFAASRFHTQTRES